MDKKIISVVIWKENELKHHLLFNSIHRAEIFLNDWYRDRCIEKGLAPPEDYYTLSTFMDAIEEIKRMDQEERIKGSFFKGYKLSIQTY